MSWKPEGKALMNRLTECLEFIERWDMNEPIITVEMDGGGNFIEELCIQACVVELLRDLIKNPPPERMIEGGEAHAQWVDFSYRKSLHGLEFGFSQKQEDAVKNLAWNYFVEGISKVQSDPALKDRLIRLRRNQREK